MSTQTKSTTVYTQQKWKEVPDSGIPQALHLSNCCHPR